MDNKISEKQKTDEENKNVRLTDEEKVKLFEEFLSEHGQTVPGLPKTRKMQKPCLPRNYFRETTYAYLSVPSH